jgi:endonuclease YncB( thermonuclease family)
MWLKNMTLRLLGIDTPESKGRNKCRKGQEAKRFVLRELSKTINNKPLLKPELKGGIVLAGFKDIEVETAKQGKFGRYLAIVYYYIGDNKWGVNLNSLLIVRKYAKKYYGKSKKNLWTKKERAGELLW